MYLITARSAVYAMSIEINNQQLKIIYSHAESIYPEECCGILLGTLKQTTDKVVIEVIPTINAWAGSSEEISRTKHSRYIIPPQEIFQAQKRAESLQLEIIGFFHSHPDTVAVPSECDREKAWEIYSYPIVSVIQGKVQSIASWVLDDNRIFQPEQINSAPVSDFVDLKSD
jgi:proteasome lid subunit RPN8/RPN11